MFSTRTALLKHLVSAEHRRLTVSCPWCTGKDKTFTRISDLEVHVKACHKTVDFPKDRFSRPNGFYFAVYPKDYARIVEGITDYDSDAAYDVRKAVRSWVEGFSDKKERMNRWNLGWKEGAKIAAGRARSNSRARSEGRKEQGHGEQDKTKDGKGQPEGTEIDRRVVERREMKRKQGETDGECVGRSSKHKRVERNFSDFETYEDDIEIGDFERDSERGRSDERRQTKGNVEVRGRPQVDMAAGEGQGVGVNREVETGIGRGQAGQKDNHSRNSEGHGQVEDKEEMNRGQGKEKDDVTEEDESASTITSCSSSSSDGSLLDEDDTDGIRARAIRLLKRGAMPVCPPAKRDWTSFGNSFEMDFSGQVLSWPPGNWRKLNADQRLMAHEYAALFIEKKTSTADFPLISRRTLLDKYAFLTLDTEGRPREEEEEEDKVEAKIRQYNFSYLKGVAKGDIPSSRVSWSILKTLENASRWADTDILTSKLDAGGVKIKI